MTDDTTTTDRESMTPVRGHHPEYWLAKAEDITCGKCPLFKSNGKDYGVLPHTGCVRQHEGSRYAQDGWGQECEVGVYARGKTCTMLLQHYLMAGGHQFFTGTGAGPFWTDADWATLDGILAESEKEAPHEHD